MKGNEKISLETGVGLSRHTWKARSNIGFSIIRKLNYGVFKKEKYPKVDFNTLIISSRLCAVLF